MRTFLISIALLLAVVPSCGKKTTPAKMTPVTAQIVNHAGAASLVPDDASSYVSSMNLKEQVTWLWESEAVQRLFRLPVVQQVWQTRVYPAYFKMHQALERHPIGKKSLPVLRDLFSNEVFLWTGSELPALLRGIRNITTAVPVGFPQLERDRNAVNELLVESIVSHRDTLKVPSIVFGFKVTKVDETRELLDLCIADILAKMPVDMKEKVTVRTVGPDTFHELKLSGADLPDDAFRDIPRKSPGRKELIGWLKSRTVSIMAGISRNYLLLGLGPDASVLEKWGKKSPLLKSRSFEPLRKHFKPELLSVSYSSQALMEAVTISPESFREMLKVFVAAIPENEAPEGLIPELQKDVALLAEDVVGAVPTLGEVLHFSFAHQGLESYSFTKKSFASYDSSQSLSLLAHRGVHPVVAVAGRSRKNGVDYDLIVKWVKKCDEYIEKYAVPDMNPMEKKNYDTLMGLLRSFGASVDATTRTLFIPAVGGNESMIVAAGRGKLKKIMMHYNGRWQEEEFAKEINIPQIGVAVRLNSALDFIKAVKQYAEAVRSLFNALKNEDVPPEFKSLTLPDPKTRSVAGGTMYYYDWPLEAGDDVFPCAILKGDLLVLATSKNLGESMLTKRAPPDCPVAGCDKPAGRICCIDLTECWSCLKLFSAALIDIMNTRGVFEKPDPQKALFIKQHIGALLTSLGALKRYSSSTIYKEGYEVTHSWLTVKDIGK